MTTQTTIVSEPPTCDICNRRVKSTSIRRIMHASARTCEDCFSQWYDPDYFDIRDKNGNVDPDLIKKNVMKKFGLYTGAGVSWPEKRSSYGRRRFI